MSGDKHLKHKHLVWAYAGEFDVSTPQALRSSLEKYCSANYTCRCSHPVNEMHGIEQTFEKLWSPLLAAMPDLERRDHILLGGSFEKQDWVGCMGSYQASFMQPLFDIPPTRNVVDIPFGEFHRMEGGRIAHTTMIIDFLELMRQAGCCQLPVSQGAPGHFPGPASHDGILLSQQDAQLSAQTKRLVEGMLADLRVYDPATMQSGNESQFWHPKMMWYGPAGSGATRGVHGFAEYHRRPFLGSMPDRKGGNHYARFADGKYLGMGGWPSIKATFTGGGWVGMPATGQSITMRVMDFYRCENGLIRENWVFLDIIDTLQQMGLDLFEQMRLRLHLVG